MIRKLTILGLALAAMLTMGALSVTTALAAEETLPAYFTAPLFGGEKAEIDGEQIGTNTITVGSQPALTCSSVKYNGEAVTPGPVSEQITISPEYGTCHVIAPALGTRTVTVTMNGCGYTVEATSTVTEGGAAHFLGDLDIECPAAEAIEVHVYNTASSNDAGASTLCTYEIEPQSGLTGTTLTNKANTPGSVDDVVADFNITSIEVHRTSGSALLCGAATQTAVYKGEATLRATTESSEFVEAQVQDRKRYAIGSKTPTVLGENGKAELTTEKGPIACTGVKYVATPTQFPGELSVKPEYPTCTFDKMTTDVDFQGCEYKHTLGPDLVATAGGPHTPGPMTISCGAGKEITITATDNNKKPVCTFTLGEQTPNGTVNHKNINGAAGTEDAVHFTNFLKELSYEVVGPENTCGKNNLTYIDGELHGSVEVRAYSDAKKTTQVGIRIRGLRAHK